MKNHRSVTQIIEPQMVIEGAGVLLRRSFGPNRANPFDPFLLFDHFAFNNPLEGPIKGFPTHPIRLAASWDLFGNGKTALKANAGKYVASAALGYAELFNTLTVASETRTWVDADGNRSVLDANGNLQRGEIIGGTPNFGQASGTIRPDPELQREYNWEYGVSLQHELVERVALTVGYHRRTYGNLQLTDNLNLSVDDWTPFEITAPLDPNLPGGGGYPITMYTLNPARVGTPSDNIRTYSTENSRVYNGYDAVVTGALAQACRLA